jgi:alkylation response protein AidB-like acyl-CoA dehydrogenase
MDFELTDDQEELRRLARDVAEQECPPKLVRAVAEDRAGDQVDALWQTFVSLDWPSLTIAEDDGGMGLTAIESVLTVEELGRVADPSPFLATTTQFVPLVRGCLDGPERAELLRSVCAGSTGAASFDPTGVSVSVDGEGWRLSGTARHVVDADRADHVAIVADTDSGPGVFVVPASAVATRRTPTFDSTLHLADVGLDDVAVGPDRSAVGEAVGPGIERARREAVTALSASMVGASQRVFELALEHIRERHQFGQPIGAFQALKHMAVDIYVAIERARALCHFAALTLAEDDDRQSLAAAMAKTAAGEAQRIATRHGVQFFGGLGYTWENDLQLFVRRAKSGEPLLGSTAHHRAEVARLYAATQLEEAPR